MSRREALEEWRHFVRAEAHVLRERPALLFQQASNTPAVTAPARAAVTRLEQGVERRPWLLWINRPEERSPCLLTVPARESTLFVCAFSPEGSRLILGLGDDRLLLINALTGEEIAQLRGHRSSIMSAAFSADGSLIATATGKFADDDMTARLWDGETGQALATLAGHRDYLTGCAFSSDGRRLVTASQYLHPVARVWDTASARALLTLEHGDSGVECCALSPDGRRAATAGHAWLRFWNAEGGSLRATLPVPKETSAVRFVAGGAAILTRSPAELVLWSVPRADAAARFLGRKSALSAWLLRRVPGVRLARVASRVAALSPGGDILAVAVGAEVRLLDTGSGATRGRLADHGGPVVALGWSPDGQRLAAAAADRTLTLWDIPARRRLARLQTEPETKGCAFLAHGRILTQGSDGELRVLNAATGECLALLGGHSGEVDAYAISPDGRRVVSKSFNEAKVWDPGLRGSTTLPPRHAAPVRVCGFTRDGSGLVTAAEDGSLREWNAENGRERRVRRLAPDGERVGTLDLSGDGRLIYGTARTLPSASLFDDRSYAVRLALLDLASEREVTLLSQERGEDLQWSRFSSDGRVVLSCHGEHRPGDMIATARRFALKLWDGTTGALLSQPGGRWLGGLYGPLARFSPDGRRVAVSDGAELTIWSAGGQELSRLEGGEAFIADLAWSPDGATLVAASEDGGLCAWDPERGVVRHAWRAHPGPISACRHSPIEPQVATEGREGRLCLWDYRTGAQLASVPGAGLHGFTPHGRYLVAARWGLELRDAVTARVVAELPSGEQVTAVGFHAAGRRIALGCQSGAVLLLEIRAEAIGVASA